MMKLENVKYMYLFYNITTVFIIVPYTCNVYFKSLIFA